MAEFTISTGIYKEQMHSVTALRGKHQRKMLLPLQLKYICQSLPGGWRYALSGRKISLFLALVYKKEELVKEYRSCI